MISAARELEVAEVAESAAAIKVAEWKAANPEPRYFDDRDNQSFYAAATEWQHRRVAHMREVGLAKAQRRFNEAKKVRDAAALAVASIVATTMEGLMWKARMWLYDTDDGIIAGSIAGDLLDMANA